MTRKALANHIAATLQASAKGASLTLCAEGTVSLAAAAGDGQSLPTFKMNVYNGGIMYPQLSGIDWKGPVVVNIAGMTVDNPIPIHRDHDTTRPVGHGSAQLGNTIVIDGVLLRDTPIDFGGAAARLRPNLVAAVLLANAALGQDAVALFHASHNNLITGSALAQATLRTARAKLGKATDGDASLNLPATHLIVPSDLGDLAVQLTMSAVITNDSGAGGTNPIRTRNIMPIEEARLANGLVDPVSKTTLAGSLTSWYLVSAEGKTIEVQYLAGTGRVPIVVVESLMHGEFGLCITVKHFCGAKALDFRSMLRGDA